MLIPIILSGGAGSRLWPVSRESHPKPFMKLQDGESLLQKTYSRASAVSKGNEILTVTNRDYYFLSKDEFDRAGLSKTFHSQYLLEPVGRNTAPAVALAALHVMDYHGPDALMLILAADHLIQEREEFGRAVLKASELAETNHLVTFGILPTGPETGFGYIESGLEILGGRKVVRFVEKPNRETAEDYIQKGNFYWNSGMFCFKAGVILDSMKEMAPEVYDRSLSCWKESVSLGSQNPIEIPSEPFSLVPDISIDYAVMERSPHVAMVEAHFGWSDIGSWNAMADLVEPDQDQNRSTGDSVFVKSQNTFIHSEDRLVAAVGIQDILIIDTPDALLVTHADHTQDVKQVVNRLKNVNHESFKLHRTVSRPWGTYTVLEQGPQFKIKRIVVRPRHQLSLQMHHHRSEHWVVVSGIAKVTNGDEITFVRANESTYIPAGHAHRLENPGMLELVMIEVQSGEYLGEDDITRFDDQYGRTIHSE